MSKPNKQAGRRAAPAGGRPQRVALFAVVAVIVLAAAWALFRGRGGTTPAAMAAPAAAVKASTPASALQTNEVAQAIMVTVELDFQGPPPSIRQALREVERRSVPDDGRGRTFAILDAYGEPTPAGKLHMSMHVSMEKPGLGELVFRRTGEVLWKSRIIPTAKSVPAQKNLTVIMLDGEGRSAVLDGSQEILRVLDVPLRDAGVLVRDRWPDGQETEFTFIYSTCGCPVKAKVRRLGETTMRTSELPVMFPDDPAAMTVISQLMGWPEAN